MDTALDFLTVSEAAAALGVGPWTVRIHLRSGRLKGRKLGSFWIIDRTDLAAFRPRPVGCPGHLTNGPKLCPEKVLAIRAKHAAGGVSYDALAREFLVSAVQVMNVVKRNHWKDV